MDRERTLLARLLSPIPLAALLCSGIVLGAVSLYRDVNYEPGAQDDPSATSSGIATQLSSRLEDLGITVRALEARIAALESAPKTTESSACPQAALVVRSPFAKDQLYIDGSPAGSTGTREFLRCEGPVDVKVIGPRETVHSDTVILRAGQVATVKVIGSGRLTVAYARR